MKSAFDTVLEEYLPYGDNPFGRIAGKTVVIFDTETTGLSPRNNQITEIGAIAVNGDTLDEIDQYHVHVNLNEQTLQTIQQQEDIDMKFKVADILKMTNYYNAKSDTIDERAAIEGFLAFIPDGSVLVAHNAKFDMKMAMTRIKNLGGSAQRNWSKVLDTMVMSREFFIPMSQELEVDGDLAAKQVLDKLTTAWTSSEKRQKVSSRLGDLVKGLMNQELEGWHEAIHDARATLGLLKEFKDFFDKHFDSGLKYNHDFIRRYKRAYDYRKK